MGGGRGKGGGGRGEGEGEERGKLGRGKEGGGEVGGRVSEGNWMREGRSVKGVGYMLKELVSLFCRNDFYDPHSHVLGNDSLLHHHNAMW